jgi:hypothetical protein
MSCGHGQTTPEIRLTTAGNVGLGLATLFYVIVLFVYSWTATLPRSDQSAFFLLGILLPVLWICLALALYGSVARGGLDWLAASRGAQKTIVPITCLSFLVVTCLSGVLRPEPVDQIPWAVRPLVPWAWAMWLFPLVVLLFCALTMHPDLGAALPLVALRAPLAAVAGLSLLASGGLLAQWFISSQKDALARADAEVSDEQKRVQDRLEYLRGLDASKDLNQVLGSTNRYADPKLRELALEKIRAVPDLEVQLAAGLRSPWCEEVLIFLDASEPPDRKPLAEPARDAFTFLADNLRSSMRNQQERVVPVNVDFDARLMVSVADKLRGLGVDYVPVIRSYRSALNEPREEKLRFDSASMLDDWLARETTRAK